MNKPRIAIYGVGNINRLLIGMADRKGWPIVAAFNRAGDKVGKDLGRVGGLDKDTGIIVQDWDTANFSAAKADVAIVATTDRLATNLPAYRKLMEAGMNVICHGTESYYPQGIDDGLYREIDAIARANNVTFTGTGIWDMSRIWAGMLVTGPCTDITSFYHRSITDSQRWGVHMLQTVGIGLTQEEYHEKFVKNPGPAGGLYKTIPHQVLAAVGYTVTKVTERREPVIFDAPYYCKLLDREIAPGLCLGTRIVVEVETKEGVPARADIELRVFHEGEIEHMMWAIEGMPSVKIRVERDNSAYMSASTMFNRIPDVIAAPPGVQVVSQLGPMKHTAL